MKKMYYNPIEVPQRVKIKSSAFGIDVEYDTAQSDGKPVYIEELFEFAGNRYFDSVAVYLTSHEGAYYRDNKKPTERVELVGWVELSEYKNGGGYLKDPLGN